MIEWLVDTWLPARVNLPHSGPLTIFIHVFCTCSCILVEKHPVSFFCMTFALFALYLLFLLIDSTWDGLPDLFAFLYRLLVLPLQLY